MSVAVAVKVLSLHILQINGILSFFLLPFNSLINFRASFCIKKKQEMLQYVTQGGHTFLAIKFPDLSLNFP